LRPAEVHWAPTRAIKGPLAPREGEHKLERGEWTKKFLARGQIPVFKPSGRKDRKRVDVCLKRGKFVETEEEVVRSSFLQPSGIGP